MTTEKKWMEQAQCLPCSECGGSKKLKPYAHGHGHIVCGSNCPCPSCRDEAGVSTGLSPIALALTKPCPGPMFKDDGECINGRLRGYSLRPAKIGTNCPICGGTSRVSLHKPAEQLRILLLHTEALGFVTMFYPPVPAFGEPSDDYYIPPEGWRVSVANRWPGEQFKGETPEEALAAVAVKAHGEDKEP